MTTVSYTAQALLVAAVEAVETANREHKKATGAPLFRLASDLGNGVTLRDLKHWLKEFKAKQAEAAPAPKATETKTPAAKVSAPKENAAPEIKASDLRDQIVLLGRAKETVLRISRNKETDVREAVTVSGLRIALGDIERTNRGSFRVKESALSKYAKKGESVPPKTAAAAVKEEKLPVEKEAIRQYPIRVLKIKPSTALKAAEYDRNTQTLFATFNDGARWAYEAVSLSDVRALENATSAGKHFIAHIRDSRKGRMVKGEKAHVESKPATTAPAPKAAAAKTEVSTTRLRAEGFMDGRKHEVVEAIQRNKTTGVRSVVTQSGKRIPLDSIVEVKGKFRVAEVAAKPAEKAPAAKPAENTRKTAASKPAESKAPRVNFDKAEVKQHKVEAAPTIADLKESGLRLVKGARSKVVGVLRVVRRDDVRVAVLSDGKTAVPFAQVAMLDGQPTYVGKLVASQFNAVEALH